MIHVFTERRVTEFMNKFQDVSLEKYLGIANNNYKFNILVSRTEEEIELKMIVKKKCKFYNILELPTDVCRLIASYNEGIIKIHIKIIFGYEYPFMKPVWVLDKVEDNINSIINLNEYYAYIVNNHNTHNEKWSPVISIDKDILEFIQKIYHFEYLLGD